MNFVVNWLWHNPGLSVWVLLFSIVIGCFCITFKNQYCYCYVNTVFINYRYC